MVATTFSLFGSTISGSAAKGQIQLEYFATLLRQRSKISKFPICKKVHFPYLTSIALSSLACLAVNVYIPQPNQISMKNQISCSLLSEPLGHEL